MDDNIIQFVPKVQNKEILGYICTNCDAQQFELFCDGVVGCAECGCEVTNLIVQEKSNE